MGFLSRDKERTRSCEDWAQKKGFKFEAQDSFGIHAYFKDMKLFRIGGRPKSVNMIQRNTQEFNLSGIFDYHYTVSTGKSSHTYKQTVYFRIHDTLMLPEFRLVPEKWYHQIGKWFGMQDINFVEYPEFSRNYILQGPQRDFIWKLFQEPQLTQYFRMNTGWSVEAVGKYFVLYKANELQKVADMHKFATLGDKLFNILVKRNDAMESELSSPE